MFGQNRVKALASAVIMDRMVGSMAKRAGVDKSEIYKKIRFEKSSETDLPKGIKFQVDAWHGSPHFFDKFTTEKMGTGEGVQAFGWGLYFTEIKSIAEHYAKYLSSPLFEDFVSKLQKSNLSKLSILNISEFSEYYSYDYDKVLNALEREQDNEAIKYIKENKNELYNSKIRNLYKVSLQKGKKPSEYTWLEWDKPMSDKALELFQKFNKEQGIKLSEPTEPIDKNDRITAGQMYEWIANKIGPKKASLFLLENGIDGIKYPAESISRGATSDTARGFNYVVFDEDAVSIDEVIRFQKDANKARGAAMVAMDGQAIIYALTDPNVSTPLHEMAHVFEHYLSESERDAIIKSAGTKGWTIETSEFFARGFEKYLADGVSPIPSLQKLFDKFKEWLLDIYNGIKGSEIDIELNDKMKSIYNSIITEEAQLETAPAEVDKIKSDIEASKERLKKAWDKYKTMGIAFDPKSNLAKDRELVKALVEYAYNNIRLGSYTASKLIEDLANQGFEMTRDGAKFIMDRASRKVQRDIDKTIGIKPKATEQKRINKAYSVGVATQKVATKEAKAEVKDLKGQVVDVFKAGIEAVKIAQSTAKEKARAIKTKSEELAKYLDELKGAGKITANQATAMVKRFSKVNVLSEKSVNRFIDYTTKVLNDADYNSKLTEARKTLSSLKKLSKDTEKNADLRVVTSEFVKIDPSMVENIDEYNDIANKLKTAVEGSKIRKANTKIVDTVNIDDVNTYVEKILTEQETKLRDEKIAEIQSLFGVDAKDFSAEEIDALLESDEDIADDDAKIVRATLNKAFDVYSTVIDEMLNTGVDPFTGEDVEFTNSQKKIIKDFMGIDLDTVTDNKDALRIIDSLINFIQNKSTAGMLKPIADFQAIVGGNELIRQKIEGKGIRKFWSPSFGKTLAEQFTSLNLLFEKEFKGFNAASKVRKMMGITDLVNGKSIGQSEANRIVKKYVEQFYNKTANGEEFNSAYNDIERGVFAHVYRSVIGTEQRKKAVFEKRKQEVLDAIAILEKNGNKEEKQLAELYKKAYDKILDGSENIEDVRQKTDANNVDGVNYWVNQWADKFDALSDLALNFYNKILNRDLGYTPDRFKRLQGETKEIDLENDESAFISNTDKVLYNKKSGSLMDKQENRKTPKGMFIDLSFDSKNSNSMYDALIDLNTAFNIRKVQSFLKSDNFNKIFKDDADLFKKRIASYVRLSRRKSPYTGSELSGLIQKLDKAATIGVTQALASPTQPFKQIIPVMASTAINAGSLGMGSAFNPSYNNWLDKLGYAISNRGIESRAEIEAINRLLEKAASSKKEKVVGLVREANEKMLKWTLVNPDVWIARASFKAYYEQYLKKEGLYNDIPKKQSRLGITEIDYDNHEPNDDAADYAQEMIDRQQNISDYDLAGDLFTDKNSITKAFIKMLMAFSSFRMNQGSRLGADLTTLEYWNTSTNEDKWIALRSIAGYTAEQAVFRGLQITFGMMFYYGAKALMGRGDDEEEDKKFKNNLIKASSTGAITDTFSPLPLLDPYVQNLSASSVDAVQDIINIPEKDKIKLFEANKQEAIKTLGVYGIVPERAGQLWDLGKLAYTRKFKDNYGREKEISQKDADALKVLIGPYLAASVTGVLAPDISSLVRKSIKIAEKGSKKGSGTRRVMSQEEYDRLTK
jgi:polyhydroxyalkanoate synthesis regulator phasin